MSITCNISLSKPVKQWNFGKANWSCHNTLTNKLAKSLFPPDSPDVDLAYRDFCNVIRTAAKHSIPCSCQNNHIPCWDAECKKLYCTFLQWPEGSDPNRVLPLPGSSDSTRNAEIDGPKQFRLLTFCTLAKKHGVY